MAFTFEEVCDKMMRLDEITLVETLELSSEEIVEAFKDKIEIHYADVYLKVTGESVDEYEEDN